MRKREKSEIKKEKIIMLATAAFALTAMTMTGVYVSQKNKQENQDGYQIDLSSLNEDTTNQIAEIGEEINRQLAQVGTDDLDVEVEYEETNAGDVLLPAEDMSILNSAGAGNLSGAESVTGSLSEAESVTGVLSGTDSMAGSLSGTGDAAGSLTELEALTGYLTDAGNSRYTEADAEKELEGEDPEIAQIIAEDETAEAVDAPAVSTQAQLSFSASEGLAWPVVGNVLLAYSMDKAVYFETLNQYRYNPSMVIEAVVGEPITAAADGQVLSIRNNVETGGTISFDLGDGYSLTYGQLENFTVSEGDYVSKGQIIGYVAEPSIFYTKEGANVYFALTKDGTAVDPMTMLQ